MGYRTWRAQLRQVDTQPCSPRRHLGRKLGTSVPTILVQPGCKLTMLPTDLGRSRPTAFPATLAFMAGEYEVQKSET